MTLTSMETSEHQYDLSELERRAVCAAEILRAAEAPIVVAGYGACIAAATGELLELCRILPRLRVVVTPRAKGVFPETHPAFAGVVGFAGHDSARRAVFDWADWVVVIGTRLGEMTSDNWDPRWTQLNVIRIDIQAERRSICEARLWLVGHARQVLRQVRANLPVVPTRASPAPRDPIVDLGVSSEALAPPSIMRAIGRAFPDQGHVYCGIGNTMAWAIHHLRRVVPNRWHLNLNSGAMGHAVPAATGAALLGAPTLALLGDAEFLMSGMELHTAVENRLPVVIVVLNDGGHGMVRIGARAHCGGIAPPTDFACPPDLVELAGALGAHGCRALTVSALERAILAALCRSGPTLIDVPVSKEATPPLGARLAALSEAFGLGRQC